MTQQVIIIISINHGIMYFIHTIPYNNVIVFRLNLLIKITLLKKQRAEALDVQI
jgi:hypothetical protein